MSRANQRRVDPEVRKDARLRSIRRIGKGLLFLVMIAATGTGGLWLNQRWSVTAWEVSADEPIKAAIEAQIKTMPSRDFLSTRPDRLRAQWLDRIPDMDDVQITRILPARMVIQATARTPMALWQDEQSRLHLFDHHGQAYRLLSRGESPDLPLLRIRESQLADARRMMDTMAAHDRAWVAALSEIRAGNGFWHIYFSRGVSWLIPQTNEDVAITQIISFLKQPRWKGGKWRVDARSTDRWFVRPARYGGVI